MGLDMFLRGKIRFNEEVSPKYDGFSLCTGEIELGYWRKHPNLHGFIVNKYADGKDECQEIELGIHELKEILKSSENDELPYTEGFFFGVSQPGDKIKTKEILEKAIKWLESPNKEDIYYKYVIYRASW